MFLFKNPNLLWLLFLMAIPLLIHLINLHRHKIIYFSQTSFLKRLEKESRRTRKLNKLLLLILRMAAIGFLVVGFAHPYFGDDSKGGVNDPNSSVVIFIDNSYSMQSENSSGNLLEQAKLLAINRIASFVETTPVKIVSHNGIVTDRISPRQVANLMSKIEYSSTNISAESLNELFKNTGNIHNSQIWLISDMHESYWKPFFEIADSSLIIVPIQIDSEVPENISIDTVWFDSPYRNAGIVQNMSVRLSNRGKSYRSNTPVRLYLNDTLISVKTVDIKEGESETLVFNYSVDTRGWLHGKLEIDDFPITFDNFYYFTYYIHLNRTVLFIGEEEFYSPLTRLYRLSGNISSKCVQPQFVTTPMLDSASCVFVKEIEKLPTTTLNYLLHRVEQGFNVIVFADQANDVNQEGQILSQLGFSPLSNPVRGLQTISTVNLTHYLFKSAILRIEKDTKMPQIESIRKPSRLQDGNVVLLETDLNNPALLCHRKGSGLSYLFTTNVIEDVNFNKHPLFVPLFINLVQFSSGSVASVFTITRNLCFDFPIAKWDENTLPVFKKNDTNEEFIPNFQYNNLNLNICLHNEVQKSGVWHLSSKDKELGIVGLNVSRQESLEMSEENRVEFSSAWNINKTDEFENQNQEASFPSLWQVFILLAFFMFALEMLLLSRKKETA
ncbi:MAG: BatA domain-containing protein [Salinivirgaceae bacterium]|nr:BatA domain-containing protein [Salinivirgaceae bacterium]